MTYGHRPNSELLAYSGFISPDEGFDASVTLQLKLPATNDKGLMELRKRALAYFHMERYFPFILKT
jgi:hypothetical protein